jgi:hypothetical protein
LPSARGISRTISSTPPSPGSEAIEYSRCGRAVRRGQNRRLAQADQGLDGGGLVRQAARPDSVSAAEAGRPRRAISAATSAGSLRGPISRMSPASQVAAVERFEPDVPRPRRRGCRD